MCKFSIPLSRHITKFRLIDSNLRMNGPNFVSECRGKHAPASLYIFFSIQWGCGHSYTHPLLTCLFACLEKCENVTHKKWRFSIRYIIYTDQPAYVVSKQSNRLGVIWIRVSVMSPSTFTWLMLIAFGYRNAICRHAYFRWAASNLRLSISWRCRCALKEVLLGRLYKHTIIIIGSHLVLQFLPAC